MVMMKCAERPQRGFTLIEAMVTVAIIAILTAIAYPNYINYVNKSKTSTGQQAIAAAMASVEQTYLDDRSYPPVATPVTVPAPVIIDSGNYFTYNYTQGNTGGTGQSYYITATGNGPLSQYFIAANSNDVRCVCLNCTANPLSSFTDVDTACPAGSTAW